MAVNWQKEPPVVGIGEAQVVAADDMPADTRRGGDVRTLLSPKTVESTSGFMGVATLGPGRPDLRALPPLLGGVHLRVRGTLTRRSRRRAPRARRGRGAVLPLNVRHRLVNEGDEDAFIVFHLGPLAPRVADARPRGHRVAARERYAGRRHRHRASSRRAARRATRSGSASRPGARRRGGSPSSTRPASARRSRPSADFDPRAAGLSEHEAPPHGPLHPVRGGRRRSRRSTTAALDLEHDRPRSHGRQPRLRRRRDDGARGRLCRGQQPRPGVARRPRLRAPVPLPGPDAEQPGERDRAEVRRARARRSSISTGCTSGIDAIGYGHQMIQDGEADIVISGAAESPISPISMACFDPIKATSRAQRRPRARLAPVRPRTATAS